LGRKSSVRIELLDGKSLLAPVRWVWPSFFGIASSSWLAASGVEAP
jgi:hypothetical protein